jgi:cation:H+ antiporter
MLLSAAAILAGFLFLIWGADRFITGAAALARNLGVSSMLIGLTIVGFGTSAPEILVSSMAALEGNPGLAIGNALGSNIANVGLILGATALVIPLQVQSATLKREYPMLLAVYLVTVLLLLDGDLSRWDGVILLAGLGIMLYGMIRIGRSGRGSDPLAREFEAEIPQQMKTTIALFWFLVGLVVLLLGSRLLVWGAVNVAVAFGVSDLVIGLTIVAIGTSLPELAASLAGALKQEPDIAIGNIIGSNMYNLLAVLAMPGLIAPGLFAPEVLSRDLPMMIGITLAMYVMSYGFGAPGRISRIEGALLVLAFLGYQGWLFLEVDRPAPAPLPDTPPTLELQINE